MLTIQTGGLYYKTVNRQIRESLARGEKEIILKDVLGQRYIAGGISGNARFTIYGTPGQDLGVFLNGPTVTVHGNAQDGTGNTMNAGRILVHGKTGEIPGHSMRGGSIIIRDDVEYRAGIHMKEYMDKSPLLVIGGTAKDYCGEYMAGGSIVVLNRENRKESPVGRFLGTGIHGGTIYVRGPVEVWQLGIGAVLAEMDGEDREYLVRVLEEFCREFQMDPAVFPLKDFIKVTKKSRRPFGKLYTPAMNLKTEKPRHFNLTPPCEAACPSGIPTPVFLNLIKEGKVREAQEFMDEYTPFRMSVCGSVCPALCMQSCSRKVLDGPVEIQKLARDYYPDFNPEPPKEKRSEKVSIIGAGPAGLSAAWQLARRGFDVHVYDKMKNPGGKVQNAIPRERLAVEALERDFSRIRSLPVTFHMDSMIDVEMFSKLQSESDVLLVAAGAGKTRRINYPGGDRIESGLDFLMSINGGDASSLAGQSVAIIGAGNVGMDIACEAWRLGAAEVTALDIQKPLAFGRELELAEKLGTKVLWPRKIDHLDETNIYFSDGSMLHADRVYFSIGEVPEVSFLPESIFRDERGYVVTAEDSFQTTDKGVFVCGDIRKPGLITDAVGEGRLAAMEMAAMLDKGDFVFPRKIPVEKKRIQLVCFGGEENDADRCMSCGTCILCDTCIDHCPQGALSRNGTLFTVDPERCTMCYTCVSVCPRGAMQPDYIAGVTESEVPVRTGAQKVAEVE
ncbi:MAG: hypothetical protein AVO39_05070 [delta proteobacterium MLS_D]|jgi:putative selenate reductase|nr:MAG: hypothetical protein AVO39_05070 [delta proteobacterium MLS_D]